MGLASKLASAQGGAAPPGGGYSGAPPAGYPPQQQQQLPPQQLRPGGSYPGQQPYQAYPGSVSHYSSTLPSSSSLPSAPRTVDNFYSVYTPPITPTPGYHSRSESSDTMAGRGYPNYSGGQTPYSIPSQYNSYPSNQPQYPSSQSPYPRQQQYGQQSYNRPPPAAPSYQTAPYQQPPYQPYPYQQQAQYGAQPSYQQGPGYGYGQQQPPLGQQYPPQGQPLVGGRPGAPSAGPQNYKQLLIQQIRGKQLEAFYPPNTPILDHLAQKASQQIGPLCAHWRISPEIGNDLCKLALYDIIIYIDDSGSMQFEENGERIDDLRLILTRVANVSTIFDEDGVQIRFMNTNLDPSQLDGIRSEQHIDALMRNVSFKGLTPMGTSLRQKVIEGIVIPKLRSRQYNKPILVITITDGQPAGEPQNAIHDAIQYAVDQVSRQFGRGAIAFQFAQVGNDLKAREFLSKLDEDPVVGQMVDCTSNFENESDEMRRQGVDLTPELWMVKLMLGAIDSSYDRKDEGPGAAGAPPPGGYGGPPAPGYGGPAGYSSAPGGGYGGPGAPPSGQYGRPPQGGPPYGGPQQGGYGGAPAPPRY